MRHALDRAFAGAREAFPTLLAVVVSAAPDGVIVWAWSRDDEPRHALGFAALHRAGVLCLEGLDDSQQLRRLQLSSHANWISSQPLLGGGEGERPAPTHLVLTTAFCGQRQAANAVMQGVKIREQIAAIVGAHATAECVELRDALVELLARADALTRLGEISEAAGVDPWQLASPTTLDAPSRARLTAALRPHRLHH